MLKSVLLSFLLVCGALADVINLTDDNFENEFATSKNWIVKFYAPWCGHCKTLKPVFEELSNGLIGDVRIGAVDSTKNKGLSEKYQIKKFPTIMYKRNDIIGYYDGARSLTALNTFANRMNDPSYSELSNLSDLVDLYKSENVVFLMTYKSSESSAQMTQAIADFKSVASTLHSHASFALLDATPLTINDLEYVELIGGNSGFTIAKMEAGRPPVVMTLDSTTIKDSSAFISQVTSFVELSNYPSVNQFDNHNFKRLSHLNKTMIIAVVDYRDETEAQVLIDGLKNTVLSFPAETTNNYVFGHLDGKRWRRFIKEHDAVLPSLLVLDTLHDLHHAFPIDASIRSSVVSVGVLIADVVTSVLDGTIDMRPTVPPTLYQKIQYRIRDYAPFSYVVLGLPVVLLLLSLFVAYPQEEKMKKH